MKKYYGWAGLHKKRWTFMVVPITKIYGDSNISTGWLEVDVDNKRGIHNFKPEEVKNTDYHVDIDGLNVFDTKSEAMRNVFLDLFRKI